MQLDRPKKRKITHSITKCTEATQVKAIFHARKCCSLLFTELPLAIPTLRPNTSHTLMSAANPVPLQHTCVYINYTQYSDLYIKPYINTYMFLSFFFCLCLASRDMRWLQAEEAAAKKPLLFLAHEGGQRIQEVLRRNRLLPSLEQECRVTPLTSEDEYEASVAGLRLGALRSFVMLRYVQ